MNKAVSTIEIKLSVTVLYRHFYKCKVPLKRLSHAYHSVTKSSSGFDSTSGLVHRDPLELPQVQNMQLIGATAHKHT